MDDDDDDPFAEREEDDDPFTAITREAAASKATAIPVSPRKTKSHTEELKCPMCDTVGFVPENSGGKDVKCCNPKCTVPVFEAPKKFAAPVHANAASAKGKGGKSKSTEPSGPTRKPLILAIAGGVALVAIVGAVVYFMPSGAPPEPQGMDLKKLMAERAAQRKAQGLPEVSTQAAALTQQAGPDQQPETQKTATVEVLDVPGLLRLMQDRSLEERTVNKKYCRQRTAIGYALNGDVDGMVSQFKSLDEVGTALQHFRIPAYLALGWNQLAKGDKAAATKTADEAMAATANLGRGSRDTQEYVVDLAAFLTAVGKIDAAHAVLSKHLKQDDSLELAVRLALARHRGDYDLATRIPGDNGNPQRAWGPAGVVLILANQAQTQAAEAFAAAVPDVEARTDAFTALADWHALQALAKKQAASPEAEALAAKLTPAGQSQLLARLALTFAEEGQTAEAERLLAAAQSQLSKVEIPPPAITSTFKQILEWTPPEAATLRQATLGAAGVGVVQSVLKKTDDGWLSIISALRYARGLAPSPVAISSLDHEADAMPTEALRDRVRDELELRSRDEAARKTRELQNKFDDILKYSTARFQLQEAALLMAARHGLARQVWQEILSLSQRPDLNEAEPYLNSYLPVKLLEQFQKDGSTAEANEVSSRVNERALQPDDADILQQIVDKGIADKNFTEAIAAFNQRKLAGRTEEIALRGFIDFAKQEGQLMKALDHVEGLDTRYQNQFVKIEVIRLLAAYVTNHSDAVKVRARIQTLRVSALDKISGYLGLLESHFRPQPAAADGQVATAEGASAEGTRANAATTATASNESASAP